jgi:hypothetical protein
MAQASVLYLKSYTLGVITVKGGLETWREVVQDHHYHELEWTPTKSNAEKRSWSILPYCRVLPGNATNNLWVLDSQGGIRINYNTRNITRK